MTLCLLSGVGGVGMGGVQVQRVEGGAMGNGGESKTSSLSPQCQNKVVWTELLARRSHASGSVKRCAELQRRGGSRG